jgi:hypothetical protein
MRWWRALMAALLLIAFAVGTPLHHAAAYGTVHGGHPHHAQAPAAHAHGHSAPCPGCPSKPDPAEACEIACAAAVAVVDQLSDGTWEPLSYPVRFDVPASRSPPGAERAPDPFPPKRPPIA